MTGRVNAAPTPERAGSAAPASRDVRWQRVAGSLVRRTPRSIVISVPATPEPRRIEGAAVYVWETLDAPCAVDDIVAALRPLVGAPTADLEAETARTLQALARAGLVECA